MECVAERLKLPLNSAIEKVQTETNNQIGENIKLFLHSECYKVKGPRHDNLQRDIEVIMTALSSPVSDKSALSSA